MVSFTITVLEYDDSLILYFSCYNFQVALYPNVSTLMYIADAAAIKVSLKLLCKDMILTCAKEVVSSRARFPKQIEIYEIMTFFGHNILVSEGEEWKKYRKISAPAFSDVSFPS